MEGLSGLSYDFSGPRLADVGIALLAPGGSRSRVSPGSPYRQGMDVRGCPMLEEQGGTLGALLASGARCHCVCVALGDLPTRGRPPAES